MAIAELICLGEDIFGQKYAPAQLTTGHAYDTLAGWVRVYRAVPKDIWRDTLDFSYHKAVAYEQLPTEVKDEYLGRAVLGEFGTAADLNLVVREEQGLIESPIALSVCCPICGEQLVDRYCNKYCTACGAKPIEWATAYWELKNSFGPIADI
jgi:ribosomal protein L37AE/L43A